MKIQLDRNENFLIVKKITIIVDDVEFEITIDKFNEVVVQKEQFGAGESAIVIKPRVSNVISLV